MAKPSNPLTEILGRQDLESSEILNEVFPLVYDELRMVAHRHLLGQYRDETLNTTALVNEAYLKMVGGSQQSYQNRRHFFAVASVAMRQLLVDHARIRMAAKRGGGVQNVSLENCIEQAHEQPEVLLALDEALKLLSNENVRMSKVVELRFFGGMGYHEIGQELKVSPTTAERDWRFAKAWLSREIRVMLS